MYSKMTYREIIEWMQLSDKLLKFLRLKTVPHYTTIQKFFKRISESLKGLCVTTYILFFISYSLCKTLNTIFLSF